MLEVGRLSNRSITGRYARSRIAAISATSANCITGHVPAGGAPYGFQGAVFPGFIVTETALGWARFLRPHRPKVLIDGGNCAEYSTRKSWVSFSVGLAKKGIWLPMRFLGRFCILLVFSFAFGLICSEIPESLSLQDDTSNDFLVSSPALRLERVRTARREPNPRKDAAPTATLPSLSPIHRTRPALPSGPNLLRLLSIQRK